ncbi:hypothetical protein BpHYR1_038781 [Brachionus plicatilis]|uniref:Uncharacterized protein n=1 Tax=Brachionus plicatilis TaxID=10195 RepID=A0A3M7SZK5_BRAPC|nr:hypothetical protein BpHYR1_038781 [Brachionus plicatilis]
MHAIKKFVRYNLRNGRIKRTNFKKCVLRKNKLNAAKKKYKNAVNKLKRLTYDEIANCHLMHISLGFMILLERVSFLL